MWCVCLHKNVVMYKIKAFDLRGKSCAGSVSLVAALDVAVSDKLHNQI